MSRALSLVGLGLLVAISSVGCVSERQYRELQTAYRSTLEQLTAAENRLAELQQEIEILKADPRADRAKLAALLDEKARLESELQRLRDDYDELAKRPVPEARVVMVDKELDAALRAFADANSDIAEYDPARGMVKFKSDLTFTLGSDVVRSDAKATLGRLATILSAPVAQKYEVRIVGHTDAVPIKRVETREKHPTNWHLAVHRAIAVRDALEASGIDPVRTAVGGYGMYRPIEQNYRNGTEPNRRVEIYLVGMSPVNRTFITPEGVAPRESITEVPAEPEVEVGPLK